MTEEVEDGFDQYVREISSAQSESARKSAERREKRLLEKAQTEHSAPMVGTPQEREERDKQRQWAIYEKSITVRKQELLQGWHAEAFGKLDKFLQSMTLESSPDLIEAVKNSVWLSDVDQKTKNDALWMIDSAIISLRIKNGMSPFDDPIMGDPPNAFMIIRKHLTGVGDI